MTARCGMCGRSLRHVSTADLDHYCHCFWPSARVTMTETLHRGFLKPLISACMSPAFNSPRVPQMYTARLCGCKRGYSKGGGGAFCTSIVPACLHQTGCLSLGGCGSPPLWNVLSGACVVTLVCCKLCRLELTLRILASTLSHALGRTSRFGLVT